MRECHHRRPAARTVIDLDPREPPHADHDRRIARPSPEVKGGDPRSRDLDLDLGKTVGVEHGKTRRDRRDAALQLHDRILARMTHHSWVRQVLDGSFQAVAGRATRESSRAIRPHDRRREVGAFGRCNRLQRGHPLRRRAGNNSTQHAYPAHVPTTSTLALQFRRSSVSNGAKVRARQRRDAVGFDSRVPHRHDRLRAG